MVARQGQFQPATNGNAVNAGSCRNRQGGKPVEQPMHQPHQGGDIGGAGWKRYDDPAEKAFKLNAERNNGGR